MRVFVAGATGVIGRPLVRQLGLEGHDVTVMTRSSTSADRFRQQGHEAVVCDGFDREGLLRALAAARPNAVIHQMTSIPPRMNLRRVSRDMAETNRLRVEGTDNLIDAAREAGVTRFLVQSIAFAYAPRGEGPATEDEPLFLDAPDTFAPLVHAIQACEQTTLASADLAGVVLRYGFFYGPGTIYAADGSFATWLPVYAEWLDAPPPLHVPRWVGRLGAGEYGIYLMEEQRGAVGTRAVSALSWEPRFGSWRDGFRTELNGPVSPDPPN